MSEVLWASASSLEQRNPDNPLPPATQDNIFKMMVLDNGEPKNLIYALSGYYMYISHGFRTIFEKKSIPEFRNGEFLEEILAPNWLSIVASKFSRSVLVT
jgi:hypothetical protein